jgi:predicted dinucleotide-binding enzyme
MIKGEPYTIAILGGTGDPGSGLANRWLAAGHTVLIGSRSTIKARDFAKELGGNAEGDDNFNVARVGIVVNRRALLES